MNDFKQTFDKELSLLKQARDELKLKLHLAKADARDEWERLETQLQTLEDELRQVAQQSKKPLTEISRSTREVLGELKAGYKRLRSRLQ